MKIIKIIPLFLVLTTTLIKPISLVGCEKVAEVEGQEEEEENEEMAA